MGETRHNLVAISMRCESRKPAPARGRSFRDFGPVSAEKLIRHSDLGFSLRLRQQVRGKSRATAWEMAAERHAACQVERVLSVAHARTT